MRNKQILLFFLIPLKLYLQRYAPLHKIGIDFFFNKIFLDSLEDCDVLFSS